MRAIIVKPTLNGIKRAANFIRCGKIIVFPSDCVYGFATNALIKKSVLRIYEIKKRDRNKPLCILTRKEKVGEYAYIHNTASKLINEFWPGPIGIILKKKKIISDVVTAGKESVALVFMDQFAVTLAQYAGVPISVTSVNFSGEPPVIDGKEAIKYFDNDVDLIINGSKCKFCESSTMINLTDPPRAVILRKGPISMEDIEKIVPNVVIK